MIRSLLDDVFGLDASRQRLCGCEKAGIWTPRGCWDVEIVSPVGNEILVRDYACGACSFLRSLRLAQYPWLRQKPEITVKVTPFVVSP